MQEYWIHHHIFHHTTAEEVFTRVTCMIDGIGEGCELMVDSMCCGHYGMVPLMQKLSKYRNRKPHFVVYAL